MSKKGHIKKLYLLTACVLLLGFSPSKTFAEKEDVSTLTLPNVNQTFTGKVQSIEGFSESGFSNYHGFTVNPEEAAEKIESIMINDIKLNKAGSKISAFGNLFAVENNKIYLGTKTKTGDVVTLLGGEQELGKFIKRNESTYESLNSAGNNTPGNPTTPTQDEIEYIEVKRENFFDVNLYIRPAKLLENIDGFYINGTKYNPVGSKAAAFGTNYYKDMEKFIITLPDEPKDGNILTFKQGDKVLGEFVKKSDNSYEKIDSNQSYEKEVHARLIGNFESAVVDQEKYDAISGATGNISNNQNSNVKLQVALMDKGQEVEEYNWSSLSESPNIKSYIKDVKAFISDNNMGMKAKYNSLDDSITLNGIPDKAGDYKIYVEITTSDSNPVKSNELDFKVFDIKNTKLSEQLIQENFTLLNSADKYEWDMEPWTIELFAESDKTKESEVKVPENLKLWHGSHKSGTYGILGYSINQDKKPHQTLVVERGTSLTLRNMKILSSTNILVKDGGKLNFYDSSLFGTITVESGGIFQMNYDEYKGEFLTGSSINGQLILKDEAILESSLIYSNANSLTDSNEARKIESPVVKVEGNVTVRGKVYIRGDEAPTGNSPTTGLPYAGQSAMELEENAKLILLEGSELGLYGGGRLATTTNGGNALILNEGSSVTGKGKLIAVGGNGQLSGDGGDAVKGNGSIDVSELFLQGGNVYNKEGKIGKPCSEDLKIGSETKGYLKYGFRNPDFEEEEKSPYWADNKDPNLSNSKPLENSSTENAPIIKEISEENNPENKIELPNPDSKPNTSEQDNKKPQIPLNSPTISEKPRTKSYSSYVLLGYGNNLSAIEKNNEISKAVIKIKLVIGKKSLEKSLNGQSKNIEMDVAPFIKERRTMIPVRFVAEALSFKVEWIEENRTVILKDSKNTIEISVDTNKIIVNGAEYESDVTPVLENDRTFLPIANISRALGLKDGQDVIWSPENQEVIIERTINFR